MDLYLYIMVDPDKMNRCKVGITKNPEQRIRAYKTANPKCYFSYVSAIKNKYVEKTVLYELKGAFVVDSEYVWSNPIIVQNIVESII